MNPVQNPGAKCESTGGGRKTTKRCKPWFFWAAALGAWLGLMPVSGQPDPGIGLATNGSLRPGTHDLNGPKKAVLTIDYPQKYAIFQRSGDAGQILIEGHADESSGGIEARFNQGSWTRIADGAKMGKFSGILAAEVGQGTLEVRLVKTPGVRAAIPLVSIGDVFVVAGQSNAAGWSSHVYEPLDGLPLAMSLYKRNVSSAWEPLRHPASASGLGSPWPLTMSYLCQDHRVPIGLITTAIGGAWLKQWLKPSGDHYPAMIRTIRDATRGTLKIRAILWFQGEADCNPSQEYAHLSFNGNHDQYLAALQQFVADAHRDLRLDTVFIGSIGNVPHRIGSAALSTRENIYHIRRALQDSWPDPRISPGPVVYDVPLASDSLHIHFNTPDEMTPLAQRWAAAISSRIYRSGVGRGPILRTASLSADCRHAILAFDQELAIGDYRGQRGIKAEGWSFASSQPPGADDLVETTRIGKNVVQVRFKTALAGGNSYPGSGQAGASTAAATIRVSYGIDDDGAGKMVLRGLTGLPVEPFYSVELKPKEIHEPD